MLSVMPPGRKPKKPRTGWAKKVLTLRTEADLTQREAAEKVGVPLRTWISWENGHRIPRTIVRTQVLSQFSAK